MNNTVHVQAVPVFGGVVLLGLILLALFAFVGAFSASQKKGSSVLSSILVAVLAFGFLGATALILFAYLAMPSPSSFPRPEARLERIPSEGIKNFHESQAEVSTDTSDDEVIDWNAIDAAFEELPAPPHPSAKIKRADINLSTLPENSPAWVYETSPEWNEAKQEWSTTILLGPYETRAECVRTFDGELRKAVVEYAKFRGTVLGADFSGGDPQAHDLPVPNVHLNRDIEFRTSNEEGWESREYRHGPLEESYFAKVSNEYSEEPWNVAFARVTFDRSTQNYIDQFVLRGQSVQRAIALAGICGVSLLGMATLLGGLKMVGAGAAPVAKGPSRSPAGPDPLADTVVRGNSIFTGQTRSKHFTRKRFLLLLAPIICTLICLIENEWHYDDDFWPVWVWLGCGIAYVMTFLPPSQKKSKTNDLS